MLGLRKKEAKETKKKRAKAKPKVCTPPSITGVVDEIDEALEEERRMDFARKNGPHKYARKYDRDLSFEQWEKLGWCYSCCGGWFKC